MITTAENNDNPNDVTNSTQSEQQAKEAAKKGQEKAKEATKKALKNKKVQKFILAHLPTLAMVVISIILVIAAVGIIASLIFMPGKVLGNILSFGRSIWSKFTGFWTGDSITASVTNEDVKNIAQYIQNMGYDISGYGFGDAVYTTDSETSGNTAQKTKTISQVKAIEGKNYLKAYIAANEETYTTASYSVYGMFKDLGDTIGNTVEGIFKKNDSYNWNVGGINEYSTGLLNLNNSDGNALYAKISPTEKKMDIYSDAIQILWFKVRWGKVFSFDLSNWTAQYGRPTELFLALHISTMMPDLPYELATSDKFNTKVNINFENVTLTYDVDLDSDGNDDTQSIIKSFLHNAFVAQKYDYVVQKDGTTKQIHVNDEGAYEQFLSELENQQDNNGQVEEAETEFFKKMMKKVLDGESEDIDYGKSGYCLKLIGKDDGDSSTSAAGKTMTQTQLISLSELVYDGIIETQIKWPYIGSVTNHWYYNDISFMHGQTSSGHGAYRKAIGATKTIKYDPAYLDSNGKETENTALKDFNIQLDTYMTSDDGIFYQVCEPEKSGPRADLLDLFSEKYYKYDGNVATATKIAKAKALDAGKTTTDFGSDNTNSGNAIQITQDDIDEYNNAKAAENDPTSLYTTDPMCKQNASFDDDKSNALSAFSILENMHTEAADTVYRELKELSVSLGYFTKDTISENLKKVLVWIVDNDSADDTGRYTVEKDSNEYGIKIRGISKNLVAPGDATASYEDGIYTLTFKKLSDETVKILTYRYNEDFKKIDTNEVINFKMQIKGIKGNCPTGDVTRGQVIGQIDATEGIQIVMYKNDKSIIDNIEDYMNPDYTWFSETNTKTIMERGVTYGNNYYGYDGVGDHNSGEDYNLPKNFVGSDYEEKIWWALKDLGYSNEAAAGVMGNLSWESAGGGTINASAQQDEDSLTLGIGIAQWSSGRRTRLETFASSKDSKWNNESIQLEFLIGELTSGGGCNGYAVYQLRNNGNNMANESDVDDATQDFFSWFERGNVAKSHMDQRKEAAEKYYAAYKDKTKPGD